MNVVVLVAGLVVLMVVLLGIAALGVQRLRRQARNAGGALAEELAATSVAWGPERAEYAGGTVDVLRPRSRGVLVLTGRRLLFREISGEGLSVDLDGLTPEVAETFDGHRKPRRGAPVAHQHLVLRGERSAVGFVVEDPEAWRAAIETSAGGQPDGVNPG